MSSEIKVDTISENTSAGGVTIDSLGIKDGKITNLMNATLSAADLGSGIHIKTADSGASVSGDADELVLENSRSGMTFLSATDNYGIINFGDSGDNNIGQILYYHGDNSLSFVNNNSTAFTSNSSIYVEFKNAIGTNETAPDITTGGLCLNQGAEDSFIMTLNLQMLHME